jgi:hypothetical protein
MHLVAKTYGKLPSDLLQLDWAEYQFCVAVLLSSLDDDHGGHTDPPVSYDWSGIAT